MKNLLKYSFMLMVIGMSTISVASCSSEEGQSASGWYTDVSRIPDATDFAAITNAIKNNEILKSYTSHNVYATKDLFVTSNGMFDCSSASCGKYRNTVDTYNTVYHFTNNNTVVIYHANAYISGSSGTSGKDVVIRTSGGSLFGDIDYCATGSTYTYAKEDGKIYITDGTILTVSGSYLILDGSSTKYSQYNPSNRY